MNKKAVFTILILVQVLNLCFSWPVFSEKVIDNSSRKEISIMDYSTLVGIAVANTTITLRNLCELSGLLPPSKPESQEEKQYPKKQVYPINISQPYKAGITLRAFSDSVAHSFVTSKTSLNYNPLHINIFLQWLYLLGIYLCFHRLKLSYLKIKDIIDRIKINNAIGLSGSPGF